ncbi:MAG TPA: RNA methyltransferase [Pseudomonadales bacterium]
MGASTALQRVRIVLVNTSHPGNIGAAARAMKNMGLTRLYLVEPKLFPHPKAIWRSAHAEDVVQQAQVVASLDEAIADCQLVVGTSARQRSVQWPLLDARASAEKAIAELGDGELAIVFGREDRGLTNEELQKCRWHLNIPTHDDYSSLNLAAAVQVVSYELQMAWRQQQGAAQPDLDQAPPASTEALELFFGQLEQQLRDAGYLHELSSRHTMPRLRRMFTRMAPDNTELGMLHGVFKELAKANPAG